MMNETGVVAPSIVAQGSVAVKDDPDGSEDVQIPTGASVIEPDSVLDADGRTYHGYREGKYFLPNDADEQDRLDFLHAQFMMLLDGKLFFAPLADEQLKGRAIDLATGTGIWALDFAEQHPQCKVIGVDLSKIQPDPSVMMPNCEFIKEDCEETWVYGNKFDYVHLRLVVSCFNDHRVVMRHAFENLKPGGYVTFRKGGAFRTNGAEKGACLRVPGTLITDFPSRAHVPTEKNLQISIY
jgi:SAM-dependent methyltransferase